jgi:hypothetical protein
MQTYLPAYDLIKEIRSRYLINNHKSKIEDDVRNIIRDNLTLFQSDQSKKGKDRVNLKYFLESSTKKKFPVCKSVFCDVYAISKTALKRLIREAKNNIINSSKSYGGRNFSVSLDIARRIKTKSKATGKPISNQKFAALVIPNTTAYKKVIILLL